MKLGWVIHYVPDVTSAVEFYERAFRMKRTMLAEGQFAMLATGETTLAFCDETFARSNGAVFRSVRPSDLSPGFEIGFVTDDVDGDYAYAVAHGATPIHAPRDMPWGQRVSYVADLNGFNVEICSSIGA